ncbi:MAG: hypothetical protein WBY44_30370 [Bryobacteraceae bacterium]
MAGNQKTLGASFGGVLETNCAANRHPAAALDPTTLPKIALQAADRPNPDYL